MQRPTHTHTHTQQQQHVPYGVGYHVLLQACLLYFPFCFALQNSTAGTLGIPAQHNKSQNDE